MVSSRRSPVCSTVNATATDNVLPTAWAVSTLIYWPSQSLSPWKTMV